jgi:hypothetical protein
MAIQKYSRIGIRRDNNFGDLSNTNTALNNLLAKLVAQSSDTFYSEDLDAIRGISSFGLTNEQYQKIIGSAALVTQKNGTTQAFKPKITYQNRIDKFKLFSGEPRINGGDGLTARYFNPTDVYENTVGIFSGSPFKVDNFWERGIFTYSGKITPESINANGGVEWEGYFIPIRSGELTFIIDSSACFTFDFQTQGYTTGIGTYTEISRIGIASTFSGSGTINTNSITLASPTNTNYVAIGQSVSASSIVVGTRVASYNRQTGEVGLTPPDGTDFAVSSTFSGNITFSKEIGQNTRITHTTYTLTEREKYRIRFRYFIPQNIDAFDKERYIFFDISGPAYADYGLRYVNLYALDYDFSENAKGEFNRFLDNSISYGGGLIGSTTDANQYVKVNTTKNIDIRYQPKTSIANVVKSTVSGTVFSGINVMEISDTSNIEIGNYVFGTGVPEGTKVEQIVPNVFILLSQNATSSTTTSYTFVEHRGFVKRVAGSISSGTVNVTSGNTNSLTKDMIVIATGLQAYTKINTIISSTSFTISPSQSIGSTNLYFYHSRGLINNGLSAFCGISQSRCMLVSTNTATGSTVIPVTNASDATTNWTVQGFSFSPGTIITSIDVAGGTITISLPTTRPITSGSNFTIADPTSGNKQLCCPPTDTSPPFNPTANGLETVSDAPNLRIDSGNLVFGSLRANIPSENITTATTSDTSRSRLVLQTPIGTYRILCA